MEDLVFSNFFIYFSGCSYFKDICNTVYSYDSVKSIIDNINMNYNLDIEKLDFKNNFDILFINQDIDIKLKLILVCMIILSVKFSNKLCDYNSIIQYFKNKEYIDYGIFNSLIFKNKIKYKYAAMNSNGEIIISSVTRSLI